MDSFYLGLSVGLTIAVCVIVAIVARGPLQEMIGARKRKRELDALFEASARQVRMEHWSRRREMYLSFRNAVAGLVEELADGGGRWANFYLARDLLRDINDRGVPDAALAARQMCFICQMMLNTGFSDDLSVKFDQAVRRYDIACRDDLSSLEQSTWPDETADPSFDPEATDEMKAKSTRRYFKVLR